jgi:uncharacterized membrane protein YbhN (UPF0104 family)
MKFLTIWLGVFASFELISLINFEAAVAVSGFVLFISLLWILLDFLRAVGRFVSWIGRPNVYNINAEIHNDNPDLTRPHWSEESAGFVNVSDRMQRLERQSKAIEGKAKKK